ncbi:hypothetical protein [Chromobacterium amazonense]|uniref:Peptidase M30 n=1 Tax=Chromobacterium amazonense TaxID=1382803 RepID=A0ABU8V1F7_9NEIS|nr:hypothetical protein [Chromobacterium amazonense]MDQ4541812.1 hypothetical protein [Chromobacterium amazonense]
MMIKADANNQKYSCHGVNALQFRALYILLRLLIFMKLIRFSRLAVALTLVGCGGGGGGGAADVGQPAPLLQPQAVDVTPQAVELQCDGVRCQMPAGVSQKTVGTVFRFRNKTDRDQVIRIEGLEAGPVWQMVQTSMPEATALNNAIMPELSIGAVSSRGGRSAPVGAPLTIESLDADKDIAKAWHVSGSMGRTTTFKMASHPLPGGGKVYVWAGGDKKFESNYQAYFKRAQTLAEIFADSIYPLEVGLLGEHWGALDHPEAEAEFLPSAHRDVHIVAVPLEKGTAGYVNIYDRRHGDTVGGNLAHALFMQLDFFAPGAADHRAGEDTLDSYQSAVAVLAHEFSHLIFQYQKIIKPWQPGEAVRNNVRKREVWESEMFAEAASYLVSSELFSGSIASGQRVNPYLLADGEIENGLDYRDSGCRFDQWRERSCYNKASALGALMVHQYGAGVLKSWLDSKLFGEKALTDAIGRQGGDDYLDLKEQFAGLALLAGKKIQTPERYAFRQREILVPAGVYVGAERRYALPKIELANFKNMLIPLADHREQDIATKGFIGSASNVVTVPPYTMLSFTYSPAR